VAPWVDGAIKAPPTSTRCVTSPTSRPPSWNQSSSGSYLRLVGYLSVRRRSRELTSLEVLA